MMEEKMLEKKVWAVVGANSNPKKYGNMILRKLRACGYKTYAVSPNYEELEGEKCYKDLSSLPEVPDVIDMVVSPKIGYSIIEEAAKLKIKNIWFQPGSHDKRTTELIEQNEINGVEACILVALGYKKM